jgi:hypothetical protein
LTLMFEDLFAVSFKLLIVALCCLPHISCLVFDLLNVVTQDFKHALDCLSTLIS